MVDHLWTGWLPEDPDELDHLLHLAGSYRAHRDEMQVIVPAVGHHPDRWLTVPPLVLREQLLADMHDSLVHCGRDKLMATLREYFW